MHGQRTAHFTGAEAPPNFPSNAQLARHLAQARRHRAETTAAIFGAAFRAVGGPLRAMWSRLIRRHGQRRSHDALMRCSDRVLADIGIAREDIPLVVRGIDPRAYDGGVLSRCRRDLGQRLEAASRARQERRRVYRELMAYSDQDLDDLGVRRADIASIARRPLPAAA